MNGFDLLLENDALSQLGCFSVQYNEAGVGSFSTKPTTSKESLRGKAGYIVNYETLSIPAFSMMHVDVVVLQLGGQNPGHMVEPSPKVMADKGVLVAWGGVGWLLLTSRVTGGTHRFPLTNFSSSTQFIPAGMVVRKSCLLIKCWMKILKVVPLLSPPNRRYHSRVESIKIWEMRIGKGRLRC